MPGASWLLCGGRPSSILKSFFKLSCVAFIIVFAYSLTNYKSRIVFTQPDFMFDFPVTITGRQKCILNNADLSKTVKLNVSKDMTLEDVEAVNPEVELGGKWEPKDCDPWQRVAIIIPYRDRKHHLVVFLNRIHPMLRKQKIAYQIFLSEQAGKDAFNRGRLCNIGFVEALKLNNFDCIIIHDVDLLPETDRNIFYCDTQARHLTSAIDEQRYHPLYYNYYGGAVALNKENYIKINGFPNRYAGWGSEDDDLCARTIGAGLLLTRPPYHIGRYKMIRHIKSTRGGEAYTNFLQWEYWWKIDGLSHMNDTEYKVLSIKEHKLYTNITSDVGLAPAPPRYDIPQASWIWFLWFFVP